MLPPRGQAPKAHPAWQRKGHTSHTQAKRHAVRVARRVASLGTREPPLWCALAPHVIYLKEMVVYMKKVCLGASPRSAHCWRGGLAGRKPGRSTYSRGRSNASAPRPSSKSSPSLATQRPHEPQPSGTPCRSANARAGGRSSPISVLAGTSHLDDVRFI